MDLFNGVPVVPFRLTRHEAQLIRAGLHHVIGNLRQREATGRTHAEWLGIMVPEKRNRAGAYSKECDAVVASVLQKIKSLTRTSVRLKFDAFEVAACALAVRVTMRLVRHGHMRLHVPRPARAKRLLDKLECYRKRAKRAFI